VESVEKLFPSDVTRLRRVVANAEIFQAPRPLPSRSDWNHFEDNTDEHDVVAGTILTFWKTPSVIMSGSRIRPAEDGPRANSIVCAAPNQEGFDVPLA
jgi:hypothetical protein